jgi:hypothetical protein
MRAPQVAQRRIPRRASSRFGLRTAPPGDVLVLSALPSRGVDQGRVSLEIDKRAEVKLTEVEPRAEQRLNPVIAEVDSVGAQMVPYFPDRGALGAQAKALSDDGSGLRVKLRPPVFTAAVAGGNIGKRRDALSYGTFFRSLRPLSSITPGVLAKSHVHCRVEPLSRGRVGQFTNVHRKDRASRSLDPRDNLVFHGKRAHEPVEVGDHKDLRAALLDTFNGAAQAEAVCERSPAGNVHLANHVQELEPLRRHAGLHGSGM